MQAQAGTCRQIWEVFAVNPIWYHSITTAGREKFSEDTENGGPTWT